MLGSIVHLGYFVQVSDFSTAANASFGLPPAIFGQPEISPLIVTLAPGNSTLPESTLPLATATPPPQTTPGESPLIAGDSLTTHLRN